MSAPTVFLSAATVDLKEWRDVLDGAFRRGGFHVLTQDKSLRSAPGDVKRLLVETIADSDCIIHLAGLGYGSDASDPFPDQPGFQCSWTQFEYYHGHSEGKGLCIFYFRESFRRRVRGVFGTHRQENHRSSDGAFRRLHAPYFANSDVVNAQALRE